MLPTLPSCAGSRTPSLESRTVVSTGRRGWLAIYLPNVSILYVSTQVVTPEIRTVCSASQQHATTTWPPKNRSQLATCRYPAIKYVGTSLSWTRGMMASPFGFITPRRRGACKCELKHAYPHYSQNICTPPLRPGMLMRVHRQLIN